MHAHPAMSQVLRSDPRPVIVRSWVVFLGVGLVALAYGVNALLLPYSDPTHWDWFMRAEHDAYFARHWRWVGMLALGLAAFTISVTLTGFRRGERWAWWPLWFWPAFFVTSALDDWHGAWVFAPMGAVTAAALLWPLRSFFRGGHAAGVR